MALQSLRFRRKVRQVSITVSSGDSNTDTDEHCHLPASLDLKHVLAEMILPESFASYSTALSTLLSSPHLLRRSTLIHSSSQMHQEKNDLSLPTPPRSPLPSRHSFDVMRRSRLNPLHAIKRCTKCGERVEKTMVNGGAGSWRAFEGGWDVRCLCGGLWHREL